MLFSFHPAFEAFLQCVMLLYVAAHYKNQPNDLQFLPNAPAQHLFALLPPIKDDETHLPEPLVVLQVAPEGNISKGAIGDRLGRGLRAGGDMIPWLVAQQFQESKVVLLSGARVARVATHPDYANVSLINTTVSHILMVWLDGIRLARSLCAEFVLQWQIFQPW